MKLIKLNKSLMTDSQERWFPYVIKTDEDRLAKSTAKAMIYAFPSNPVENIYNFMISNGFNCSTSKNIISRLERIIRAAILYKQNPELI